MCFWQIEKGRSTTRGWFEGAKTTQTVFSQIISKINLEDYPGSKQSFAKSSFSCHFPPSSCMLVDVTAASAFVALGEGVNGRG